MSRIILDITTIIKWQGAPVSVVRTLYELTHWFKQRKDENVLFVYFSDDKRTLKIIDHEALKNILNDKKFFTGTNTPSRFHFTLHLLLMKIIRKRIEYMTAIIKKQKLLNPLRSAVRIYRHEGFLRLVKKSYYRFLLRRAEILPHGKKQNYKQKSILANNFSLTPKIENIEKSADFLVKNDIFISIGLDWDYSNYDLLYSLKKNIGFQFISAFYDAIPIIYPQQLYEYFYLLFYLADKIFCASKASEFECLKMLKEHHFSCAPQTKTIYLGDQSIANNFISRTWQDFCIDFYKFATTPT